MRKDWNTLETPRLKKYQSKFRHTFSHTFTEVLHPESEHRRLRAWRRMKLDKLEVRQGVERRKSLYLRLERLHWKMYTASWPCSISRSLCANTAECNLAEEFVRCFHILFFGSTAWSFQSELHLSFNYLDQVHHAMRWHFASATYRAYW